MQSGHYLAKEIANSLSVYVFVPFLNIVCYFVSDLGGLYGVLKYLACQATKLPLHDLPQFILFCVFVVLDILSATFDPSIVEAKLQTNIRIVIKSIKKYKQEDNIKKDLGAYFYNI